MTKEEIFEMWAPPGAAWSDWVKPVLFACMDEPELVIPAGVPPVPDLHIPLDTETALVIDLPGATGVQVGIMAARSGYRPVPLYNALPGPRDNRLELHRVTVPNVWSIVNALVEAAPELSRFPLNDHSPPAFLLDANRRGGKGRPMPGTFDNRSVSFTTDFPSANYLAVHGIRKALLVQEEGMHPQTDLAHTLLKWQQEGIAIFALALSFPAAVQPIQVKRPSSFGKMWYRVLLALGLRRDLLGGFGGIVPEPSSG